MGGALAAGCTRSPVCTHCTGCRSWSCSRLRGIRDAGAGTDGCATTADGLSIAYKQWGQGGRDIVLVPGTMWHSELIFELAPYRRFAERLGTFARVISFDKRGTGLSDRHLGTGSLDDRIWM